MSGITKAYVGAQIHDGQTLHEGHALAIHGDGHVAIMARDTIPLDCPIVRLTGGMITPGFVDLQVNGGGSVMFNDAPSVDTLHRISNAHRQTGTTAILPTLITDTPGRTQAAIDAVDRAIAEGVEGIAGIHLEGPHLSKARKGAHDEDLIRVMEPDDLALVLSAADRIANVMVTVAPESVTNPQITLMAEAGIVVSLGHTDADATTCHAAFDAGTTCVTHLFNAMSQLTPREPGLVGATLERDGIYAGLIADGIHVHPTAIRMALAAKPDRIFLVTDAMATAGSDIDSFQLNGRDVFRRDGRLTLADETLAGADLEMAQAVRVMADTVGDTKAIARATSIPATLLRDRNDAGSLNGKNPTVLYFEKEFANPRRLHG